MCPLVDSITYMGPWVWSFIPITILMLAICGAMLYLGAEKFSQPSTDRLRREEAERQARMAASDDDRAEELVS